MTKQKEIYYSDELNDDFANSDVEAKTIDSNYDYAPKNIFWKITSSLIYICIAFPLAYLYSKIKFRYKIVNKNILKKYKGAGYFLYINHTQTIADVTWPGLVCAPKRAYIIANPDNVSLPILKDITKMVGAIPVPSNLASTRNFMKTITKRIDEKAVVAIYPEAHVWNYYTKIRPFKDTSFKYPVLNNVPAFSLTITYQKSKFIKTPRIVAYLDGPFFASKEESIANQKLELRNKIYETMVNRSKANNIEYIKYKKVSDKND